MKDADEALMEQAKAFARTLKKKPIAEQIGELMLAFDGMDFVSAKALTILVSLEND